MTSLMVLDATGYGHPVQLDGGILSSDDLPLPCDSGAEIRIRRHEFKRGVRIRNMVGQINRQDASPRQVIHPDLTVIGHVGKDVPVTRLDFVQKVLDRRRTADVEGSIDRYVGGIRPRQRDVIAGRRPSRREGVVSVDILENRGGSDVCSICGHGVAGHLARDVSAAVIQKT